MKEKIIIAIVVVILIAASATVGFFYLQAKRMPHPSVLDQSLSGFDLPQNNIVCAQDVWECPDGSFVSRTGPECEFEECPGLKDISESIESDQVIELSEEGAMDNRGEIIYFYGEECPHCQDVNQFLEDNNIVEKVDFEKKEVWHDEKNQAEMAEAAENCGLGGGAIGVPFLYAGGECLIGTPQVEAFFRQEAGI